jgi:hypothetical protein
VAVSKPSPRGLQRLSFLYLTVEIDGSTVRLDHPHDHGKYV